MIESNLYRMATATKIRFELVGDWDGSIRKIGKEGNIVRRASVAAQIRLAKEIVKHVKNHIIRQDIAWIPLTDKYLSQKEEKGYRQEHYRMTNTYLDNITWWTNGNNRVFAGVKRGIYGKTLSGKRSKIEVAAYAYVIEKHPTHPRPLWDFVTQFDLGGAKGIQRRYEELLYLELRKRGSNIGVQRYLKKWY